jgi:hypothetical protein
MASNRKRQKGSLDLFEPDSKKVALNPSESDVLVLPDAPESEGAESTITLDTGRQPETVSAIEDVAPANAADNIVTESKPPEVTSRPPDNESRPAESTDGTTELSVYINSVIDDINKRDATLSAVPSTLPTRELDPACYDGTCTHQSEYVACMLNVEQCDALSKIFNSYQATDVKTATTITPASPA